MPDPITTLGLAKTTTELIKEATQLARAAKNTDLAEKLIDVYQNVVELTETNQQLRSEIQTQKNKVKEVEAQLALTGEVFREGDLIFREGERGAHCSRCWDSERKLIHIVKIHRGKGEGIGNGCPQCKTFYWRGHEQNPRMKQGVAIPDSEV
jgi:hypothetical protein